MIPPILLSTLNARFAHASFGLRCLAANMGDLTPRTRLVEFDINQRPLDIAEALLAHEPALIGLGVYVWNARPALEVARLLKRIAPQIPLIVGGPEVSYEAEEQEICALADVVIQGEADLAFAEVCRKIISRKDRKDRKEEDLIHPLRPLRSSREIIRAEPPDLAMLASPYALYDERDLAHRVLYVEASRGCPHGCEFCLSSLATTVRPFPLERFLADMDALLQRGARRFKFVDRTFNLHLPVSLAILDFFRQRLERAPGLFLHFEIVPDRLPVPLREALAAFPSGAVQLEVGVQTFNPEVAARIHRRQDDARVEENLRWLREHTAVHLHADLIAGLPGESLESFGRGFDRLFALRPQDIQVGILKRLRGAPIARHTEEWGMVYAPDAPYELLCNRDVSFADMQRVRRFAKYWERLVNRGHFPEVVARLLDAESPFRAFMDFSDWAYEKLRRTDSIARETWEEMFRAYPPRVL